MAKLFRADEVVGAAVVSSAATAVLMDYISVTSLGLSYTLFSVSTLLPAMVGGIVGFLLASLVTQLEDFGVYV